MTGESSTTSERSTLQTSQLDLVAQRARFQELQQRKREAVKLNRQEVYTEASKQKEAGKRAREPTTDSTELQEQPKPTDERIKNLQYSIEDCEKWERLQAAKSKRQVHGAQNYEVVADRAYNKDLETVNVAENKTRYEKEKSDLLKSIKPHQLDGLDLTSHRPSPRLVQKLVGDLKDGDARRTKRRRTKAEEDGVHSFINDKNRHFNMKLNREQK